MVSNRSSRILVLLVAVVAAIGSTVVPVAHARASPALRAGLWQAWLEMPGGPLPFGLELVRDRSGVHAFIHNPPERIAVHKATWQRGELVLDFAPYESILRLRLAKDGRTLDGLWRKRRDRVSYVELKAHASLGGERRFARDPASAASPLGTSPLAERWSVQFASDSDRAVAILRQHDEVLSGTFLTTTGDYRYLSGNRDGDRLRLSCFDGAHAFLFDARLVAAEAQGQGEHAGVTDAKDAIVVRGDFWSSVSHHDTFVARPDDKAELLDGFQATRWQGDGRLGTLRFPDLDGTLRTLDDPGFAGRARIIQVFGTWCPNCNDEAAYLVELHRRYRGRGLHILGLAFEATGELEHDTAQVRRFAEHHGIAYPILVAGLADKDDASKRLPLLDRVRAYPTTIFLHSDGRVRAVHTGYAGPATGSTHQVLRREFEAIIEELLAEPKRLSPAP